MVGKPNNFRAMMEESSSSKKSRVILALDISARLPKSNRDKSRNELLEKALSILKGTAPHLAGLKINHQLLLPLGLYDYMQDIVNKAKSYSLPLIMDCKANDVEHTNRWIARHYFDAGFDAIIANPFVGWEGGIEPIVNEAREQDKGMILLTYMSHPGAIEGYGQQVLAMHSEKPQPQYLLFAQKAVKWGADGVVAGATYPDKIREINQITRDKVPIYSPGIGAQGGDIKEALKAGCKYPIIGRAIFESEDPGKSALEMKEKINKALIEP